MARLHSFAINGHGDVIPNTRGTDPAGLAEYSTLEAMTPSGARVLAALMIEAADKGDAQAAKTKAAALVAARRKLVEAQAEVTRLEAEVG